jgi:hypothetical protein
MATYYVSTSTGSDSTGDGLSPSTAWKTIGKAIGSSPAITLSGSGDTLYIAPGVYREAVTLSLSPTAAGPLTVAGDPTGVVFGVAPGVVDWRGWSTDTTVIAGSSTFSSTNKSYVTLRNVKIIGAGDTGKSCLLVTGTCSNWTVQDCVFVAPMGCVGVVFSVNGAAAWNSVFERCDVYGNTQTLLSLLAQTATTEYSLGMMIANCRFWGRGNGLTVGVVGGGTGTAIATGVTIQNCRFDGQNNAVVIYSTTSTNMTTPIGVYGSYFYGCQTGLLANNNTQVAENGNVISCAVARTSVNIGTDSIVTACPAFDVNDGRLTGLPLRPFGEPSPVSPLLAFGNFGSTPAKDLWNQTRPATASAGPLEIETLPGGGGGSTYIFQVEG